MIHFRAKNIIRVKNINCYDHLYSQKHQFSKLNLGNDQKTVKHITHVFFFFSEKPQFLIDLGYDHDIQYIHDIAQLTIIVTRR